MTINLNPDLIRYLSVWPAYYQDIARKDVRSKDCDIGARSQEQITRNPRGYGKETRIQEQEIKARNQ